MGYQSPTFIETWEITTNMVTYLPTLKLWKYNFNGNSWASISFSCLLWRWHLRVFRLEKDFVYSAKLSKRKPACFRFLPFHKEVGNVSNVGVWGTRYNVEYQIKQCLDPVPFPFCSFWKDKDAPYTSFIIFQTLSSLHLIPYFLHDIICALTFSPTPINIRKTPWIVFQYQRLS